MMHNTFNAPAAPFMAPDGTTILGLKQRAEGAWPVYYPDAPVTDPAGFDGYAGDGPHATWEGVELQDHHSGDEAIWVDVDGFEWLTRHLIPTDLPTYNANTGGLWPDTCADMQADLRAQQALALLAEASGMLEGTDAGPAARHAYDAAAEHARYAAAVAERGKAADLQRLQGGDDDTLDTDPVGGAVADLSSAMELVRGALTVGLSDRLADAGTPAVAPDMLVLTLAGGAMLSVRVDMLQADGAAS